jgi:hypothetical protein
MHGCKWGALNVREILREHGEVQVASAGRGGVLFFFRCF